MHCEDTIKALRAELQERHGCHTVILYGSRARGDESPDSDYDLAGFAATETMVREARMWEGRFLDLFVYPESCLDQATPELLKMRGGVVLVEKAGLGTLLLARLEALFATGAPALSADEAQARRLWATKMLERAKRGDVEGNYRRVWLLTVLLEDYFSLRGLWFSGPKISFEWLREHDSPAYKAFAEALEPAASLELLALAVSSVIGDA